MSSLEAISKKQSSLEALMSQRFAQFEATLQNASPGSDTIASLKTELQIFKETTSLVLSAIRQQIEAINNTVDNQEMRHRRKYLLLAGIPETSGENVAEVVAAVCRDNLQLAEASSSSFSVCHRLGPAISGRSRSILVRCTDVAFKDVLWRKKTALKGSRIVMSEFLTRQRQAVFLDARGHFGIRSVWTWDGTIFVKCNGKTHRVITAEKLKKLISEHPSSAQVSTEGPSAEASVSEVAADTCSDKPKSTKPAESSSRYPKRLK